MDRNSIVGIVLIAGILILWTTLNKPSKEEMEAAKHKRDSISSAKTAGTTRKSTTTD